MYMVFKEVERIMKANGWAPVYRIGFQYHYRKAGCESPAPITDLGGRALPIDILENLQKITGLSFSG